MRERRGWPRINIGPIIVRIEKKRERHLVRWARWVGTVGTGSGRGIGIVTGSGIVRKTIWMPRYQQFQLRRASKIN